MVDGATMRALNAWCGRRELVWSAPSGGRPVMTLRPANAGHPWQGRVLVLDGPELRLENERGETLASASDLPALLDAVDGGVGEPALADPGSAGWPGRHRAGLTALVV